MSTSSVNSRAALVGAGGAALAFFIFRGTSSVAAVDPLDAMPKGSFIVATADVGALRQAPVFELLLGKDGGTRALGMGSLAEACGFDPLARVSKIAVAVPEDGEKGEFGVAAKIAVTSAELEACTKALGDRSGKPVATTKAGTFVVVEGPNGSRLAYAPSGLLLVGRGKWLEAMMASAEKRAPSAKDDPAHAALRRGMASPGAAPAVLVTAILPKNLRDGVRAKMEREEEGDASAIRMAGVLGVSTVGLAMRTGERIEATLELVCDSKDACSAVNELVQKQRAEWSRDMKLRFVGLTAFAESIATVKKDDHLTVTASADSRQLASSLERVMMFGNRAPPSVSGFPAPGAAPGQIPGRRPLGYEDRVKP